MELIAHIKEPWTPIVKCPVVSFSNDHILVDYKDTLVAFNKTTGYERPRVQYGPRFIVNIEEIKGV
jgi:hypothetical protein